MILPYLRTEQTEVVNICNSKSLLSHGLPDTAKVIQRRIVHDLSSVSCPMEHKRAAAEETSNKGVEAEG